MPSVPIIRDVKWKSPWYINPLTSRTTVSPSCSNFSVLLTLIFLELISNTNTLGADLKLIGCIIAEKQWGHFSWVSCFKDPSHLQVDFGVSSCKWLGSLKHETHEKCPHCFKDPSHLQVDFGVSSFSYNTSSSKWL